MDKFNTMRILKSLLWVVLPFCALIGPANAKSCFSNISYVETDKQVAKRALYILIDETVPLSKSMKSKIAKLLDGWGKQGDKVRIARFSASYRGLYPELVFDEYIEQKPSDQYMFNLHYRDKKAVMKCLEEQQAKFKASFAMQMKSSLNAIDPKIPKSELLGSLKLLSKQLILKDEAEQKVVFLISDGLENSAITSFYGQGKIRSVNPQKEISKIRRQGKIGYWKNTKVYMYGLGLMPDKKQYVNPDRINSIKRFWERYFVEGGGRVKEIGTPELLLTSIE